MLCFFRMSLEHTTENMASVSGIFVNCGVRAKQKKNCVTETPARVFLFGSARAHSVID